MDDNKKTKAQLIRELNELREKNSEIKKKINENGNDSTNPPNTVQNNIWDIISRQPLEKELKLPEESFVKFFQSSPDMIGLTEIETGNFVEVNNTAFVITGYTREEFINNSTISLKIWPNNEKREKYVKLIREKGNIRGFNVEFVMKSGEIRFFSVNADLLNIGNKFYIFAICRDITEKKLIEDSLKISEAKFKTLIEKVPSITYMCSFEENYPTLYISPQIERFTQYPVYEFIKNPTFWSEIILPEDYGNVIQKLKELNKGNTKLSVDYRMKAADGHIVWFHDEASLVLDRNDNPLFLQGIMVDITDKKDTEEKLKKQNELLQTIFDHIPIMLNLIDKYGKIKIVNKEWKRLLGWSLEETDELEGLARKLYPDPDYRKLVFNYIDTAGQKWYDFKTHIRDGRIIDTSWTNIKLSDGTIIGIGRDITEQKKAEEALQTSEERLKFSLEGANDGLWDWNLKTGEIYFSPRYYTMLGYEPDEFPPSYENFVNLIYPDQREKVEETIKEYLEGKRSKYEIEFLMKTKNGEYRWILSRGKILVRDEIGKPVRMTGTHIDITERKNIENALYENEQRINLILKSLPIALFTISLENTHYPKWISNNVELLTGFPASKFLETYDFWAERVHPDDLYKIIDLSRYSSGINLNEHRWLCADGQYQWFLNYASIKSDENGIPKEITGTWQNIHERKLAEEKMHHSELQLRALADHLETIREEERNKIAREVHDEFGQSLTALKMIALSLKKKLPKEDKILVEKAKDMADLISSIIQSVQKITSELRPQALESLGLVAALEWYSAEFTKHIRIKCILDEDINEDTAFDDKQSITIYRIFQETLTNVARHSNAKRVKVYLKSENGIFLMKIEDNGIGMEMDKTADPKSFGLIGMKERAFAIGGEVLFESTKGKGTTVNVKIPLSVNK